MFQPIKALIISITIISFSYADVFMTELTDPQNSSDAGRYVELYNNGNVDVDLSSGWALQRWTNGNTDPQTPKLLTGSISAGGFFIICNNADQFNAFYGLTCDQDIGTGGAADSNGDDNIALLDASGAIVDMFGVPGEDGSGTGHEFEDGRAERNNSVCSGNATWDESEWTVDNDSADPGGEGPTYAPEGFDPSTWIGSDFVCGGDSGPILGCMDPNATNYDASATEQNYNEYGTSLCTYASCEDIPTDMGCLWGDGTSAMWWEGWWNCPANGGEVCGLAEIIFELDLPDDISGTPHVQGTYNGWCGDCYNAMSDEDGDGIWSHTQYFSAGEAHEYKYSIGAWESDESVPSDCSVEGTANRGFTAGDANSSQTLAHCWSTCDSDCNQDDTSCIDDCTDFDAINNYFENGEGDFTPDQICTTLSSWGSDSCLDDCDTVAYPEDGYCGGDLDNDECDWYSEETCTATDGCEWLVTSEYEEIMMTVTACTDCLSAGNCNELFGDDDENVEAEYNVTFNVDMTFAGAIDTTNGVRIFGLSSWSSDDATSMTCDDNNQCTATISLLPGDYQFKYRNGWDYEDVDNLDCASESGGYWNRDLTVSEDISLNTVCFGACSDCAPGCTDSNATNYDENANVDNDSCEYEVVDPDNIFFSEYGEGSSYNKYLEIFNATDNTVDLSAYQRVNCSNGCDDWEYFTAFADGAAIAPGDVYVLCDSGVSDDFPASECDESGALYFNGDDTQGLYHTASSSVVDIIGELGDDPGSGWEVAGVNNGTKDHSIVRDASVASGNAGTWNSTEWVVLEQNTWTFIGSHPHDFASTCDDDTACNFGDEGDCTYSEEGYNCDGQALINVTFHVNMSEQQVDTVGYGLSLFLDGFNGMLDDDGDGIWSQTLTLVANTTYSYKFKNGDEWEVNFNDLGCGDGDTYGNRIFTSGDADMDVGPFCFNSCEDCVEPCNLGDVNSDDSIDVLDIVLIVDHIVYGTEINCADVTGDGAINVLDIVALVDSITGSRSNNATSAAILLDNNTLSISANGYIGGVQMTLSHGNDFSIDLTDDALVAEYNTSDNQTTLVVVVPGSDELFSYSGDFEIVDMIVANSSDRLNTSIVRGFSLSDAYPNPFNPTTSMTLAIPEAGNVSVQVYNIMGQVVATLATGYMDANTYTLTWDASDVSSGMYFVKAESAGTVTTQKLVLMK